MGYKNLQTLNEILKDKFCERIFLYRKVRNHLRGLQQPLFCLKQL